MITSKNIKTSLKIATALGVMPSVAFAQPDSFRDLVESTLLPLLQLMAIIIIAVTVLVILWNGVQMIINADNVQKKGDSKAMMLWSVVVLFIMVGVWGIVAIMRATLGV